MIFFLLILSLVAHNYSEAVHHREDRKKSLYREHLSSNITKERTSAITQLEEKVALQLDTYKKLYESLRESLAIAHEQLQIVTAKMADQDQLILQQNYRNQLLERKISDLEYLLACNTMRTSGLVRQGRYLTNRLSRNLAVNPPSQKEDTMQKVDRIPGGILPVFN